MPFSQCRIDSLKKALDDLSVGSMYVRDVSNIEWLTGFENVFDEEQAHAMFVPRQGNRAFLHSDSRYITALEREAGGTVVEVDAEIIAMSKWARSKYCDLDANALNATAVAIEDSISLAEYRQLEKAFKENGDSDSNEGSSEISFNGHSSLPFVETQNLILKLRAVKDDGEIALLKEAQAITDKAFDHICGFIKPGMTEREIQLELDDFMMRNGAEGLAFPSIIASGANGASPHAIVSEKPVKAGECIVMDFGAKKHGYCSDMTRTIFLGKPDGQMRRAWDVLRQANESVQGMLKSGVTGKEAHELALKVLEDGSFAGRMGHGLGHGVGIQVHELPNLNAKNDKPLEPGNVVTVEPGIYIPGEFGMRLEDFGVVTKGGFERFTRSTHEMVVL